MKRLVMPLRSVFDFMAAYIAALVTYEAYGSFFLSVLGAAVVGAYGLWNFADGLDRGWKAYARARSD